MPMALKMFSFTDDQENRNQKDYILPLHTNKKFKIYLKY